MKRPADRLQPTIVVVEDNVLLRENVRDYLSARGCKVLECGTLLQAEALVRGESPDAVIADYLLPDGNANSTPGRDEDCATACRSPPRPLDDTRTPRRTTTEPMDHAEAMNPARAQTPKRRGASRSGLGKFPRRKAHNDHAGS